MLIMTENQLVKELDNFLNSIKLLSNIKIINTNLEKELTNLQKKMFIYETLNAEKEIKEGKTKGPFKRGKDIIKFTEAN